MANTRNFGWRKLASMGLSGAVAATLFAFSGTALHPQSAFAQTSHEPFTHFAHPRDGDSIRRGQVVRVVTNTMFEDPPADARLESSEDQGVTWVALEDVVIRGRVTMGVYRPTEAQGVIVKFRAISNTEQWFNSQVETFVDP